MSLTRQSFFALFFLLTACSTGQVVSGADYSLVAIQKTVMSSLPVGVRKISTNRREFFSKYFVASRKNSFQEAKNEKIRAFAHVFVLGDRRPYDIEILVKMEKRLANGEYEIFRRSEGIARRIARDIRNSLVNRKTKLNIIDDFRAF